MRKLIEHIAAGEGVTLVRPASHAFSGLAYYQGSCVSCQQARQRTLQRLHH
jgi:hypothetical protein